MIPPVVGAATPASRALGAAPVPPAPRAFGDALAAALPPPGALRPAQVERALTLSSSKARGAPGPSTAPALLEAVDRARARLDGLLAQARAGRTFSGGELLALQAEAYRTMQTVDLATRLVEQGAQSVKQALATPL
jgi:hypothetical protein